MRGVESYFALVSTTVRRIINSPSLKQLLSLSKKKIKELLSPQKNKSITAYITRVSKMKIPQLQSILLLERRVKLGIVQVNHFPLRTSTNAISQDE